MEALAALGVAAAAVQFVDFGLDTVRRCREIKNAGEIKDHADLRNRSERLKQLEKDLAVPVSSSRDQKISDLGKECTRTAQELLDLLAVVYKTSGKSSGVRHGFKVFSRTLTSKSKLNELETRLQNHQKLLETSLIADLRQRADLMALRQRAGFQALEDDHKLIIARIAAGYTGLNALTVKEGTETRTLLEELMDRADLREKERFEQLNRRLAEEHITTRNEVTGFMSGNRASEEEHVRDRAFIDSLCYEELEVRQEQIEEAWEGTLKFVFDESPYDHDTHGLSYGARRWDNFADWLRIGSGIYWIEGKAGSGKSTLMSFVTEHPNTAALLRGWNDGDAAMLLKFFFWRSGSAMQRSTAGLLRSLLLQLLRELPDLVSVARQCFRSQQDSPTWNIGNLKRCLEASFPHVRERICIFIDGLDEYEGDPGPVLDLFLGFARISRTKLCISSRPELALLPLL